MAGTYPSGACFRTLRHSLPYPDIWLKQNSDKHFSLLFAIKASNQPFEWSPVKGSTWVGSILAYKYHTRMRVTDSDKHPSLL
jgi:hypothetical protein